MGTAMTLSTKTRIVRIANLFILLLLSFSYIVILGAAKNLFLRLSNSYFTSFFTAFNMLIRKRSQAKTGEPGKAL
jgi:hypothetical protein